MTQSLACVTLHFPKSLTALLPWAVLSLGATGTVCGWLEQESKRGSDSSPNQRKSDQSALQNRSEVSAHWRPGEYSSQGAQGSHNGVRFLGTQNLPGLFPRTWPRKCGWFFTMTACNVDLQFSKAKSRSAIGSGIRYGEWRKMGQRETLSSCHWMCCISAPPSLLNGPLPLVFASSSSHSSRTSTNNAPSRLSKSH